MIHSLFQFFSSVDLSQQVGKHDLIFFFNANRPVPGFFNDKNFVRQSVQDNYIKVITRPVANSNDGDIFSKLIIRW